MGGIGLRMLTELDPKLQKRLVEPASQLGANQRLRVLDEAKALGLLGRLGPLREALES